MTMLLSRCLQFAFDVFLVNFPSTMDSGFGLAELSQS